MTDSGEGQKTCRSMHSLSFFLFNLKPTVYSEALRKQDKMAEEEEHINFLRET